MKQITRLNKYPKGLQFIQSHDGYALKSQAQLYDTLIVDAIQDNAGVRIKLNTGGWVTRHTIKCMNLVMQNLGLDVKISTKNKILKVTHMNKTYDFRDGHILTLGVL